MHTFRFNVIGAGRLGQNLAISLIKTGQASLQAIVSKQFINAKQACLAIKAGHAIACLTDLPPADLIFITTPDDIIAQIALELADKKLVLPGSIIVHCSGVLSSDILRPLQELGCFIANFHPLKAFRKTLLDPAAFSACDCAIEGDEYALNVLATLFNPLGANLVAINPHKKAIYHAAAVLAANHLVTLATQAIELFMAAGIKEQDAKQITTRLIQTSLDNIKHTTDLSAALTGPLVRGDIMTIAKHLKAQENLSTLPLYKLLSLQSLSLTSLSAAKKELLIKMLED
ncbi:Uncharacterized conserved protein [Legionella beliardensis]|uniref:Uncharacterized conserved protein n=1 Tax=Legionella beliardensis TaxID=91822 RepID=A0A378HYZ1_9GAMM|nr:DUF2520 domain-containing protein [Legionella beliardensis]STX27506.1 Uncharacterized conserved protein [Legionella beliardensis]